MIIFPSSCMEIVGLRRTIFCLLILRSRSRAENTEDTGEAQNSRIFSRSSCPARGRLLCLSLLLLIACESSMIRNSSGWTNRSCCCSSPSRLRDRIWGIWENELNYIRNEISKENIKMLPWVWFKKLGVQWNDCFSQSFCLGLGYGSKSVLAIRSSEVKLTW